MGCFCVSSFFCKKKLSMSSVTTKPRLEVVDSLRGFAIMAIMLLHSIEHFNFYVFPNADAQPAWLTTLDNHIWDSLFFLFGGKGYAIFALLFGFTFSLMYRKQQEKGGDFAPRFLWRLLLLAGFAVINGAFFPGEILSLYAMVGAILIIVRRWNHKALLVAAVVFLLQPVQWWQYIQALIQDGFEMGRPHSWQYWGFLKEGQLGDSFFNLIKTNTRYGHLATFWWSWEVGRTLQTIGLFILGYWLGLKNLFEYSGSSVRFWQRVLIVAAILFIPFYLLENNFDKIYTERVYRRTLLKVIDMYGNLTFTLVLVAAFWLLYRVKSFRRLAGGLRYPGRMSLTAYVLQSIVGGFVFYGYGLALGPQVRHTISLGIGIVLWIGLFYFFKWWVNKYGQGPLEKLWHKLTWI